MKKRFSKRVTSLVLTLAMLVTTIPLSALSFSAATVEDDSSVSESDDAAITVSGENYSVCPMAPGVNSSNSKVYDGITAAHVAIAAGQTFYAKIMVAQDENSDSFKYLGLGDNNETENLTTSDRSYERADLYWKFTCVDNSGSRPLYTITSVLTGYSISLRNSGEFYSGYNYQTNYGYVDGKEVRVDCPGSATNSTYYNTFWFAKKQIDTTSVYGYKMVRSTAISGYANYPTLALMGDDSSTGTQKFTVCDGTSALGTNAETGQWSWQARFCIQKVVEKDGSSAYNINAPVNFTRICGRGNTATNVIQGTLRYIRDYGNQSYYLKSNVYEGAYSSMSYKSGNNYENQEYLWKLRNKTVTVNGNATNAGLYVLNSAYLQNATLAVYNGDQTKITTYSAQSDGLGGSDQYAMKRQWYIYDEDGNGKDVILQSRLTGKFLNLSNFNSPQLSDDPYEINMLGTDGAISSVKENVKMHLFDYGCYDSTNANMLYDGTYRILDFKNESKFDPADVIPDAVTNKTDNYSFARQGTHPVMKKTLVNGMPVVEQYSNSRGNFNYTNTGVPSVVTTNGGWSLDYLFDWKNTTAYSYFRKDKTVDYSKYGKTGLFQKSANGYYYYDSRSNAAWYIGTEQIMKIGDFITTPKGTYPNSTCDTGFNISTDRLTNDFIGGFFPFNNATSDGSVRVSGTNTTDGQILGFDSTVGTQTVTNKLANYTLNYGTQGSDWANKSNYWYGMTLEFDFRMTENGQIVYYDENKVKHTEDMQFHFSGDDDVWVYIDNVLVLDIGGTHGRQEANINFASGIATDPNDNVNGRTLQTIFNAAGVSGSFTSSGTFTAGTTHTLKFFYLERGGEASNCQVYFNMETIGVGVSEELDVPVGSTIEPEKDDKEFYVGFAVGSTTYLAKISKNSSDQINSKIYNLAAGTMVKFWEYAPSTSSEFTDYKGTFLNPKFSSGTSTPVSKEFVASLPSLTTTQKNTLDTDGILQYNMLVPDSNHVYSITTTADTNTNVHIINETTETLEVVINYYDRAVITNEVPQINTTATSYTSTETLTASSAPLKDRLGTVVTNSANKATSALDISNLIDTYTFWQSQTLAESSITSKTNQKTNAKYTKTSKHTDCYSQPWESNTDANCNWVTYYDGNKTPAKMSSSTVESGTTTYNEAANSVRKVVIWLHNELRTYSVTYKTITSSDLSNGTLASGKLQTLGTDAKGNVSNLGNGSLYVANTSAKTVTSYYNQRFGGVSVDTSNDNLQNSAGAYLDKYNIKGYTYDEVESYGRFKYNSTNLKFLYWAADPNGKYVVTTDREYGYRTTCNMSLYAVYGPESATVNTGVYTVQNLADSYRNETDGTVKVRLNTVLTPYGSDITTYDSNITKVAVCYAYDKTLSESQVKTVIGGGSVSGTTTAYKTYTAKFDNDSNSYDNNTLKLTNKNRVQFTANLKKSTLGAHTVYVYTAMYYKNSWIVSSNYATFTTANIAQ